MSDTRTDREDVDDEPEDIGEYDYICSRCSGSGEGMYDGSTCQECRGTGAYIPEVIDDREWDYLL